MAVLVWRRVIHGHRDYRVSDSSGIPAVLVGEPSREPSSVEFGDIISVGELRYVEFIEFRPEQRDKLDRIEIFHVLRVAPLGHLALQRGVRRK